MKIHKKLTNLLTLHELKRLAIVQWGPDSDDNLEDIGYLAGADEAPIRTFLAAHFVDLGAFRLYPESGIPEEA